LVDLSWVRHAFRKDACSLSTVSDKDVVGGKAGDVCGNDGYFAELEQSSDHLLFVLGIP